MDSYQRTRSSLAQTDSASPIGGVIGKDLKLFFRDKNMLVGVLIIPAALLIYNCFLFPGGFKTFSDNFTHAATLAFVMGTYILMLTAFGALRVEQHSLWMFYAFPKPLHQPFLHKTYLWTVVGLLYPLIVLSIAAYANPRPSFYIISDSLLVVIGIVIYSFVATGLGILATDLQEINTQRMIRTSYVYLYMFLAGSYVPIFYTTSIWTKIVQLVFSVLLAVAVWQKVRERLPYALDPTQIPPARINLSDGLIALLAFFSLQSLFLIFHPKMDIGVLMLSAYVLAGGVVTVSSLLIFWRGKLRNILRSTGIVRNHNALPGYKSVLWGVAGGVVAGFCGLGYLWLLGHIDTLQIYHEEMLKLSPFIHEQFLWLVLIGLIAAPLFEEYLFRGILFKGLSNTFPQWSATLLSAVLFASVHPPLAFAPVFVLGLVTATLFAKTKWLLPSMLAHMIYNLLVFCVPIL